MLTNLFLITFLFLGAVNDKPKNIVLFDLPVKIPVSLSANFGELRIDHFHSGLDIRTQGVTGKEVVAAASGYIYRISVSPGGFGKALYIRHPSGYSTVYGHLEKFTPEIDEYVKERQYEKKSFLVTLFPDRDKFPVSKGDIIAYSGNSGSSGGPHLHFEVRKSDNEIPVNPLLFGFGTSDHIKPVIEKLLIYPINRNTLIDNQNRIKWINVTGSDGKYNVSSGNETEISGIAGFGIKSFDRMDDNNNKFAVYSIELLIDSVPVYKYIMDSFSFDEARYLNSHIDYETFMHNNIYIERAFVLPNDKLSAYSDVINRGTFNFNDNRKHLAQIVVTDMSNNKSTLSINLKAQPMTEKTSAEPEEDTFRVMPYNRSNRFEAENLSVYIPSGALYDTLDFIYKETPGTRSMLSPVYSIHNKFTPLQKSIVLSIKPDSIPAGKKSKMLIIRLDDDYKKVPAASSWSDQFLTAEVKNFGRYFIGVDTVPPEISPEGALRGAVLTGRKEIRIRITDDLSGINYYEPVIDGQWALFEYDQKNDLLIYRIDGQKIKQGTRHSFSLKVADNKDNVSVYQCDFTW